MKKYFVLLLAILVCSVLFQVSFAQVTEPPLGLPSFEEDTETVVAQTESATPTATVAYTATRTATTQEAVDDAEVGSEIVMMIAFSLVGGIGIFLVKKYFDLKRFEI